MAKKRKIDVEALRQIKEDLIADGFLAAEGGLTEKGIREAEKRGIKPSPDALIINISKKTFSLKGSGGKLVGAVMPVSKKSTLTDRVKSFFKRFRKK